MKHYMLIDDKVVTTDNVIEWAKWFGDADRHVAVDEINGMVVSTVFLGIDHSCGNGSPVLWETIAFHGSNDAVDDLCNRYTSHQAALQGHKDMVCRVRRLTIRVLK